MDNKHLPIIGFLGLYMLLFAREGVWQLAALVFLLLAFLWFAFVVRPRWTVYLRDRAYLFFLLFSGWLILTSLLDGFVLSDFYPTLLSQAPTIGLLHVLLVWPVRAVLLSLMLIHLFDSEDPTLRRCGRGLFWLLVLGVLGPGLFRYVAEAGWETGERLTVFAHYNFTGMFAVVFLPLALAEAAASSRRWKKLGFAGIFLAGFVMLFWTQSRGALFAFVGSGVVFGVGYLWHRFDRRGLAAVGSMLLVLLLIAAFLPGAQHTAQRVSRTHEHATEIKRQGLAGRIYFIWPRTERMIKQRPLTGYRVDSYRHEALRQFDLPEDAAAADHPHSTYLEVLYEGGLVGFVLFALFAYFLLRKCIRSPADSATARLYALGLLCAFFFPVLVHGLIEPFPHLWYGLLLPWMWTLKKHPPG